ncbi:MAG: retroviral-like aspartic protease family protein [Bacteroidales bacterium]|nr:retroviral-like aspartic protease family protein [Bacteroidales bacterium]
MKKCRLLLLTIILFVACGPRSSIHPVGNTHASHSKAPSHQPTWAKGGKTVVPMHRENGVCYVVVKINGVDMEVIFDTGASDVVISSIEALFLLKQGKLTEDDIIGTSYFQVANGGVSAGTVVRLSSVQIGDKVLSDVRATVVDNMEAPLLLGQSALDRFSSVSIDYSRNVIYIE